MAKIFSKNNLFYFVTAALLVVPQTDCKLTKSFYVVETRAPLYKAHRICRENGLELATIESEAEENFLEHYMRKAQIESSISETCWINGHRKGYHLNEFEWTTLPPKTMTYTKWHPNEPNNSEDNADGCEHCLAFSRIGDLYGWNDVPCSSMYEYHFICMKYQDGTVVNSTTTVTPLPIYLTTTYYDNDNDYSLRIDEDDY